MDENWAKYLFSCIAALKPFQIRVVFDTNTDNWATMIKAKPGQVVITWPAEEGYSSGGTLSFQGGWTDIDFGAGDLDARIEQTIIVTPSGKPTIVAGTPS